MSTVQRINPFNGQEYPVGVWKWVGSATKNGEKTDVSTFKLLVPTYGSWAGPEWASGDRVPTHSAINWSNRWLNLQD